MRIVIAPDSFKGSMSSVEAAKAIAAGFLAVDPSVECILVPMADGGEGTVDAMLLSSGGEKVECEVEDPLGRSITAYYGWFEQKKVAVIEIATASGLPLLKPHEYDPLRASTYGTGQLIQDALSRGAAQIIIGLGGSATIDGGTGCLQALGIRFYDRAGKEIRRVGGQLSEIATIDRSQLDTRLHNTTLTIASDVTNPLLGNEGSVHVFGRQKGVRTEQLAAFESGMAYYARLVEQEMQVDYANHPGSGAAGGFGFGLLAFCNCQLESGFALVAQVADLEAKIQGAQLVISGEGSIDSQSLFGKVPVGVGLLAKKHGVVALGFAGKIGINIESLQETGISLVLPIVDQPMDLAAAMEQGPSLIQRASERFYRTYSLGASK